MFSSQVTLGAGAEQLEAGNEYKPEFTHQVFDGERIMGYAEGEVTIRIRYTRTSLHFLVEINTCDNNTARYVLEATGGQHTNLPVAMAIADLLARSLAR